MNTKRKIIVFSLITIICVLMLTSSIAFSVKKISIVFSQEAKEFINENSVLDNITINKNDNMFFVDKNKLINEIETNIPYANVNKIEKIFPNKISIDIGLRKKMFYIKTKTENSTYYTVLDKSLKVLEIKQTNINPFDNCVELLGIKTPQSNLGEFLSNDNLTNFIEYLNEYLFTNLNIIQNFISIEQKSDDLIIKTKDSLLFTIHNYNFNCEKKAQVFSSFYQSDNKYAKNEYIIKTLLNGTVGIF